MLNLEINNFTILSPKTTYYYFKCSIIIEINIKPYLFKNNLFKSQRHFSNIAEQLEMRKSKNTSHNSSTLKTTIHFGMWF